MKRLEEEEKTVEPGLQHDLQEEKTQAPEPDVEEEHADVPQQRPTREHRLPSYLEDYELS